MYKGDSDPLKYVIIALVCTLIMGSGYKEIVKQRSRTALIDQSVRLISFMRAELNYRRLDCESLYLSARKNGFNCVSFENGVILPCDKFPERVRCELTAFFSSLGTTDADGQLLLCDEYYERIKLLYGEQRSSEKSKVQVDFAVSLLGVFVVIVLFL